MHPTVSDAPSHVPTFTPTITAAPTSFTYRGIRLIGGVIDSTQMDAPYGQVALDTNQSIAFVTGDTSNTVAAVSYEDPQNPVVLGSVTDATSLNGVRGASYDSVNEVVIVAINKDKGLAVVSVKNPNSMSVVGDVRGESTYMDGPIGICLNENKSLAYVASYASDSLAVVSYADQANPTRIGGVADSL